jgi:hypothetical protein
VEVSDLSDALGDLVPEDATELTGASTNFGRVLEALDKERVDRNYLPPAYLRDDLVAFLKKHERGVFWLQAPAHVGKTMFVQGLTEAELKDEPIDPRFEGEKGGKLVAYYCRKEYRTGLPGMIYTLHDKLQAAYDPSQNLRDEQPQARHVVEAGTPQAFLTWLSQWKAFAERNKLTQRNAPLVVAIDGLDEADAHPESRPLQVLPRPGDLPAGVYLVLTSSNRTLRRAVPTSDNWGKADPVPSALIPLGAEPAGDSRALCLSTQLSAMAINPASEVQPIRGQGLSSLNAP